MDTTESTPSTPSTPSNTEPSQEPITDDEAQRLLKAHNESLQAELEKYKLAYVQEFAESESQGRDLAVKARNTVLGGVETAARTLLFLCEHAEKDETRFKVAQYIYEQGKSLIAVESEGLSALLSDLTK